MTHFDGSAFFADSRALLYKLMARLAQQTVFSSVESLLHWIKVPKREERLPIVPLFCVSHGLYT